MNNKSKTNRLVVISLLLTTPGLLVILENLTHRYRHLTLLGEPDFIWKLYNSSFFQFLENHYIFLYGLIGVSGPIALILAIIALQKSKKVKVKAIVLVGIYIAIALCVLPILVELLLF